MLKLCGALLVFSAASAIGGLAYWRLQRRVQTLQGLQNAFERLRTEIAFLQTPLAQAAERTQHRIFTAFAKCLEAGALPQTAMQSVILQEDSLLQADKDILLYAARLLGSTEVSAQCRHIDGVLTRLSAQLADAKHLVQTNGRLYIAFGVLGGLLLVILLL